MEVVQNSNHYSVCECVWWGGGGRWSKNSPHFQGMGLIGEGGRREGGREGGENIHFSLDQVPLELPALGQLSQVVSQHKRVVGPREKACHRPNHTHCLSHQILLRVGGGSEDHTIGQW